jgi:hypothetical protein
MPVSSFGFPLQQAFGFPLRQVPLVPRHASQQKMNRKLIHKINLAKPLPAGDA